jgi:Flp pilus assembly protein TadD
MMLVVSAATIGCGGDDAQKRRIIVQNPQKRAPVSTAAEITPTDTASAPEAAAVGETVVSAPEPTRVVTYEEAEAAFHERRFDQAVDLFARYTEQRSENPWGHYMLGLSAWKAGQHDRAEKAFEQALAIDSLHVKSYLNLGRVLLDTGKPLDALVKIREALAIDPASSVACRLEGRVFRDIRQMPQAIDAYRRAIQLDNTDAWSMNNLGLVFIEEERFAEALPPLARAVELQGDNAIFVNNLGMALECNGHFRAAEAAYESAIASDASHEKAAANLNRVAAVLEEPGLEPVDLAAIARSFIDEIESWSEAVVASERFVSEEDVSRSVEQHETDVPESNSFEVSDTDSTEGEQDR